jgi:hypothetical protein
MRRGILFLLSVFLFGLLPGESFSQCNPHKIAKDFKPNLNPYKYDSYAYNNIKFTDKPQTIEVLFTAFAGVKYKLVFGTSLFDENVQVNIYDKSMRVHKRNKLFDNNSGVDNLFWSHEFTDPGNYYIDYEVPAKGNSKSPDGCVVLLIGYIDQ